MTSKRGQYQSNLETTKICFADASGYWHLRVEEELIKLGTNVSSVDPGLF